MHALVNILRYCYQAVNSCLSARALFVDFAKAFDHVDSIIVLNKLAALGVQSFIGRYSCTRLYSSVGSAELFTGRVDPRVGSGRSRFLESSAGRVESHRFLFFLAQKCSFNDMWSKFSICPFNLLQYPRRIVGPYAYHAVLCYLIVFLFH
jgi:hypothetical protein